MIGCRLSKYFLIHIKYLRIHEQKNSSGLDYSQQWLILHFDAPLNCLVENSTQLIRAIDTFVIDACSLYVIHFRHISYSASDLTSRLAVERLSDIGRPCMRLPLSMWHLDHHSICGHECFRISLLDLFICVDARSLIKPLSLFIYTLYPRTQGKRSVGRENTLDKGTIWEQ